MNLTRMLGTAATVVFLAPTASALSIDHKAILTLCQLTGRVHGECISVSEASILNGTSYIDIDCRVTRDAVPVTQRLETMPADEDITFFRTRLHTRLYPTTEFCAINRSKYRSAFWPTYPVIVGQPEGLKCEWVQGSGVVR